MSEQAHATTVALCAAANCETPSPDAYLCGRHSYQLDAVLAELPGLLLDLDVTRTRMDDVAPAGNRARRSATKTTETACWCGCTTIDPWHHVSHHGHLYAMHTHVSDQKHARPDLGSHSALPMNDAAAYAQTLAENRLGTWCLHLVETRGLEVDLGPQPLGPTHPDCDHPSCVLIREPASTAARLARWLLAVTATIRLDEGAGELLADVVDLRRRIRHVVDRPPDRVFAGPCSTDREGCQLDLYAPAHFLTNPDANAIVCDGWNSAEGEGCGKVHTYTDRRGFLLDSLETHSAPMMELLPLLCQLLPAPQPPRSVLHSWRDRGDVPVVGKDLDGNKLVSAADLAAKLRRYRPTPQRARTRRRQPVAAA